MQSPDTTTRPRAVSAMMNCWPRVWPSPRADMDAGQEVVDVALDQLQPVLERGVEGGAEIVGVDDRR